MSLTPSTDSPRKTRQPGWWYPWIFVGGLAVVVIVNGVMIFFATTTFTGLQTEQHYVKGLAYNRDLELAERQRQLGWNVYVGFLPDDFQGDSLSGHVTVQFRDRYGLPVADLAVRGLFLRPTVEGYDTPVTLVNQGGGSYGGRVTVPLPGQWDLQIVAERPGVNYQLVTRMHLP